MPDCRILDNGVYEYSCGRCGRPLLDHHATHLKFPAANLFGDRTDYVLVCGECAEEMFPKTMIFVPRPPRD